MTKYSWRHLDDEVPLLIHKNLSQITQKNALNTFFQISAMIWHNYFVSLQKKGKNDRFCSDRL